MQRSLTAKLATGVGAVAFALWVLIPIYWIVMSSLTPGPELLSAPPNYFPVDPWLHNFQRVFDSLPFGTYALNSFIFAAGSAALSVVVAFLAAYGLARYEFRGRQVVFMALLLSVALPQITTTLPLFRLFNHLQLVNTLQGLVILMASLLVPFTIWLLVAFIRQVPPEVEEAARMDGASMLQILWRIVLPLTRPALGTLFLINFVTTWNELFFPLIFTPREDVRPLALGLLVLGQTGNAAGAGRPWDLLSALSVLLIIPVVVLTIVFQRRFVAGLTRGAVKG